MRNDKVGKSRFFYKYTDTTTADANFSSLSPTHPVGAVFRALGTTDDRSIIEHVVYDLTGEMSCSMRELE